MSLGCFVSVGRSLERAADLGDAVKAITAAGFRDCVPALARALNAPPSSCFNLIRALQARGYLYSVQPRRQLYPTRRLFEVANAIVWRPGASPPCGLRAKDLRRTRLGDGPRI